MASTGWQILLIEDDEDDYILTRAILNDIHTVQVSLDWVMTVDSALEAFENNQHDAILVDYDLGSRSGLDLVREAALRGVKAPLIMLSGRGSYETDVEAMHLGAVDYLSKEEVTAPLLERTIRYAIERKHTEEELERRVRQRTQELANREEQIRHLYQDLEKSVQEEHRVRRQLILSERHAALSRMLASVTHELNNPIQTIENSLYLATEEIHRLDPESSAMEMIKLASVETKRMAKLINQLRDAFRPSRDATYTTFNLVEVVDEVHVLLEPHLQHQSVTWGQHNQVENAHILGAKDQLKQVFLNLGLNAIEAMQPQGGRLEVGVYLTEEPGRVKVSIQDSGPGIPPESLNQIFDPFFTTKPQGIGLGLSICYEIVENHHGQITVESPPGQGATFSIWLPLAPIMPALPT